MPATSAAYRRQCGKRRIVGRRASFSMEAAKVRRVPLDPSGNVPRRTPFWARSSRGQIVNR